jgi:hypothetical protein
MRLVARTLRYLAGQYLAEPNRSSQHTSRTNAAEAHAILRQRRREQDDVDAYLRAQLAAYREVEETVTRPEGSDVERAR